MDPLLYLTGCALTGLLSHPHLADNPMTCDPAKLGQRARDLAKAAIDGMEADLLERMTAPPGAAALGIEPKGPRKR